MKKIEDALGKATEFEYDERANLAKRTDALSHITQWSYDALDRMVQETNAISGVTELGYDAAGNVVTVKDPMQSTTTYGYDGLSRLVSVTQPLGQTVRYEWDLRDRLAKKILARSSLGGSSEHPEIRYAYETWGPLAFVRHYAKSSDTTPLKTITYVRNRAGDLISVTDDSIQAGPLYTYEVDKLGRTTKTFAKYIPGGDRRLDYAYDARGDLTTFTLNEPNETLAHVYTYAADSGRIATALFPGESTALAIARWPHDGVKSIDYPGGVRREVDYDVRGPVSEIRIKPPSGTPLIEKWTYTYTDVLNVATMTDGASRQTTYQYDALDRLTQADHPAMPAPLDSLPDVENFTYDGVGNRTMSGYEHDANHRMRESPGHTYDYDDDGNLVIQDPNTSSSVTRSWDLDNMATSYSAGATNASYAYDHDAHRLKKMTGTTPTLFLWGGNRLVSEYSGTGVRQTRYSYLGGWGPDVLSAGATLGTEVRQLIGSDRLDTPRVTVSAAGATRWRATYEVFGAAHVDPDPDGDSQASTLNIRSPGQYLDDETGVHDNHFRNYDPSVGRYASADILGLPAGLNLYAHVENGPTAFVDPSGLLPTTLDLGCTKNPRLCATLGWGAATTMVARQVERFVRNECTTHLDVLNDAVSGALFAGVLGQYAPMLARAPGAARAWWGRRGANAASQTGQHAGRGLDDVLANEELFGRWLRHSHPADKPLSAQDARKVWDRLIALGRKPRLDPGHPGTKWDGPHINVGGSHIPVDPSFRP